MGSKMNYENYLKILQQHHTGNISVGPSRAVTWQWSAFGAELPNRTQNLGWRRGAGRAIIASRARPAWFD